MARSPQYRDSVLKLLEENPIHPTVDWIHGQLRKAHPKVSLATVYRTLKALVAEGILCELPFGSTEARFGLIREERHYHFICDECHRIFDLPVTPKMQMERSVQQETGHEVTRHTMEFYGRCRECSGKRIPGQAPGRGVRGDEGGARSRTPRRKERTG
jgi:Fur family transcriptional regulator, peroxide stress response regulator